MKLKIQLLEFCCITCLVALSSTALLGPVTRMHGGGIISDTRSRSTRKS